MVHRSSNPIGPLGDPLARHRPLALSGHAGHASRARGNARGAAIRLCQIRACPRDPALADLFQPCPAQLPDAGGHDDRDEYRFADCLRADHRNSLPMAGMGMLFIQAVTFLDIPVMAAYLCIISFIFVVLNTLVDVAYAVIDPRLRTAR